MKRARRFSPWMIVFFIVFSLTGCSENSPIDADGEGFGSDVETDLNSAFGGYQMTDESPAFGDEELLKSADDGAPAEDPVAEDAAVILMGAESTTDAYAVRITWGMLEGDSSVTEATDWSGSISLSRGAIIVERTILFERGDTIVRPRTDRKVVDLVSKTMPHYDGLLLTILDPHTDTADAAENVLTIALGPFEETFLLSELVEREEVFDVGVVGSQVSITSFLVEDFPCPRGFLSGRWGRTGPDGGLFLGRWISRSGAARGFLKGHWGIDEEGRKVFFGKYISVNGEIEGLLRGAWGHRVNSRAAGWFRGVWHGEEGPRGYLHGVWREAWHGYEAALTGAQAGRPRGFFHGHWFKPCDPSGIVEEVSFESGTE